jgi:hypothetical protein
MSRRLFAFLLSELEKLRLVCQNPKCGNVAEVTLERLAAADYFSCPFCNYSFVKEGHGSTTSPLAILGRAILAMQDRKGQVEVEVVFPDRTVDPSSPYSPSAR